MSGPRWPFCQDAYFEKFNYVIKKLLSESIFTLTFHASHLSSEIQVLCFFVKLLVTVPGSVLYLSVYQI